MANFLSQMQSIASVQFMLMMVIIGLILIFHDGKRLKKKGDTKDYKMAKGAGICYLIIGVGIYIFGKIIF